MAWKGIDSGETSLIASKDIKWAQWLRVARNFQLRLGLANHSKATFDGFDREVGTVSMLGTLDNIQISL